MYDNNIKTDWNNYYKERKKNNSKIILAITRNTRKITDNIIINMLKKSKLNINSIIELGGADSCFYETLRKEFNNCDYTVIDNSKVGIDIFNEKYKDDKTKAIYQDILLENIIDLKSDLVFSAGLIEHFNIDDTSKMIQKHFHFCNDNGLVLITFPTPTILYRILRKISEIIGIWKFPDERPLKKQEVLSECKKYGNVLEVKLNWLIGLTQYIILVKKF